jgi:polyhydroxybutyrate depolymerase
MAVVVIGVASIPAGHATPAPSSAAASPRPQSAITTPTGVPVPSPGCSGPVGPPVTNALQGLVLAGRPRWYLLTTPPPGTPDNGSVDSSVPIGTTPVPRPLVLDFHGVAETALTQADTSQFGTLGQQDGFVVVTPSGTGDPVHWDTTDPVSTNPDLQFVSALLDQVEATQCIDTSRVYAAGFSDGAVMASQLACTLSQRIAAIGAVSGLQLPERCAPSRSVPVVTFHGTADPVLYFNGGVDSATLTRILGPDEPVAPKGTATRRIQLDGPGEPAAVRGWAAKDGCEPKPTDTRVGSQLILRRYACPSGTGVEFYIVLGGGHAWPGSVVSNSDRAQVGMTTFEVSATAQIWEFLRQFQQ